MPTEELQAFIAQSREDGLTIVECIKGVAERCDLNLGQAKQIVTSHPAWVSLVTANEPLHDEAIATLNLKVQQSSVGSSPLMDTASLNQAFLAGESIKGLLYAHNDYVLVVSGPHAGITGSLVSLLSIDPEPTFVVELESGKDVEAPQSNIRPGNA